MLSELKINPVVKENSKRQKQIDTTCSANGQTDRLTATLGYEISTV